MKMHKMNWSITAQATLTVSRKDGMRLQIVASNETGTTSWAVIALQGPEEANIDAVLDNHAHEYLGKAEGLHEAMVVAESYAARWQKKRPAIDDCDCKPIASPLPESARPSPR